MSNVLRFTEPGKQYPNPGSRIPAILQTATNGLKICSFVNANGDYCVDTVDFADGATVDIAVKQSEDFGGVIPGNFKYEVLVDGDVVHSAINAEPRVWSNVEAQFGPSAASTPNNQPQATGTYKDLVYISKCDKINQSNLIIILAASPCNANPCQNGGSCTENAAQTSRTCACQTGFFGRSCESKSYFSTSSYTI